MLCMDYESEMKIYYYIGLPTAQNTGQFRIIDATLVFSTPYLIYANNEHCCIVYGCFLTYLNYNNQYMIIRSCM